MSGIFSWISAELEELRAGGLERFTVRKTTPRGDSTRPPQKVINLAGNDYLGLGADRSLLSAVCETAETEGTGAGASRLLTGTLPIHEAFENAAAELFGTAAALLYSSGYLANLGVIPVLARRNDLVIADKHIHASLIDAIHLSRAELLRFRHNDTSHLRALLARERGTANSARRILIVTESIFSMEGDEMPVRPMIDIAHDTGAMLLVDESHAVGVYGKNGGGLLAQIPGAELIVRTASLGKSFATTGGVVGCSEILRKLLVSRSRSFIFNTALLPPAAAAALEAITYFKEGSRGKNVLRLAARLRSGLEAAELEVLPGSSPIIGVPVQGNARCIAVADELQRRGILVAAIRAPTVRPGTERLRLSVSAAHDDEDIDEVIDAFRGLSVEQWKPASAS